jgi:uncharacterized protein YjbJ (UPF0337 family)
MNSDTLQGEWHQLKGKVKAQWGRLTDDQIDEVNGNVEVLAGHVQKAYGLSRDEAEKNVDDWAHRYRSL